MQHLFSPDGNSALIRVLQQAPLLAFDFDGTLAPIVARPNDARLSRAVSARLATLVTHLPVAIVTGRSVDDVRSRLGFEPHFIVGNHGAESDAVAVDAHETSPAMAALRRRLREQAATLLSAGVTVEDKVHSLALHYRLSRTREHAHRVIAEILSDRERSLRVFGGKLVVNVVPQFAPDKAEAVQALLRRSGAQCVLFAGDDVNDEPVFATAAASWLTVRVGRDNRKSKAKFFLDSPGEMAMLLERMISLLAR